MPFEITDQLAEEVLSRNESGPFPPLAPDAVGRAHDHENLFVVGAPTCVSGGCNNGTLTFAALSLRSAEEIGRAFPARQTA